MIGSKIIIVGKGGSGKDYLKKKFIDKGFKPSISHTSRPPREGEVDGVDYHFVTKKEFDNDIDDLKFHEYTIFNKWYYGTSVTSFDASTVFIKTPTGISSNLTDGE